MDARLLQIAARTRGFLPPEEGLALHRAAQVAATRGPLLEVGGYCGLSAIYLGAAARAAATLLFSVDHHRGSEENQAGCEYHDPALVDPHNGRIDSLPFFRRTIEEAGLEDTVVAVVGRSADVARAWSAALAMVFIDGGHTEEAAMSDYQGFVPKLVEGGVLAIHDVFPDPADGGQAPFHVWQRARREGFQEIGTRGSLRILRRP
jgi:predicted O-methyltransferase YrrM